MAQIPTGGPRQLSFQPLTSFSPQALHYLNRKIADMIALINALSAALGSNLSTLASAGLMTYKVFQNEETNLDLDDAILDGSTPLVLSSLARAPLLHYTMSTTPQGRGRIVLLQPLREDEIGVVWYVPQRTA